MRAALVGTIVATCAASMATPALADVKAGVDAWQQGDYAKAIAQWRPMAAAGDPDAQFNLGQAYKLGRGVPADMPIAMDWFRKASAQGHPRAADNLGLLLFQQGKREEAMPFIRKSAERGEPRAQYILGTALFNGDLETKDWVKAYALMTRAAASGLEQATNSLATMDKYIGTDQRQKGLALAAEMARAPKPTDTVAPAPVQTAAAAPTAPRAAPVKAAPAPAAPQRTASVQPKPVAPQPRPPEQPQPALSSDGAPPETNGRPGATYDDPPKRDAAPPRWGNAPPPRTAAPPVAQRPMAKPPQSVAQAPPVAVKQARPPAAAAPPTVAKPPTSGSWRVQMGAFREAPRAKALWQSATARVAGLSDYKLFLVGGGDVTRVQAGPLRSEADAARLCGKLRAAGYSCLSRQN